MSTIAQCHIVAYQKTFNQIKQKIHGRTDANMETGQDFGSFEIFLGGINNCNGVNHQ